MKIRDFSCKNYKNLRDVSMTEVPNLLVLIGINSSGKSNLLEALALVLQNFGAEPSRNLGAVNDNLFWNQLPNRHPVTLDMHVELTEEDLDFLNAGSPLPGVPVPTQPPFKMHITKVLVARGGGHVLGNPNCGFSPFALRSK